jgi:hypothetical protein
MKARIIGPRRASFSAQWDKATEEERAELLADIKNGGDIGGGWLGVDVEYSTLPSKGDHITLNGGSTYIVRDISWYVEAPTDEDYWTFSGDYKDKPGVHDEVHIYVSPPGENDRYDTMDAHKRGYEKAVADVRQYIEQAGDAGLHLIDGVQMWLAAHPAKDDR